MILVRYFWWRDNIQTQFSIFYNEGIVSMMTRKHNFSMCTFKDKSTKLKQKCEHSTQNGIKHTPVCFESIVSGIHERKWQKYQLFDIQNIIPLLLLHINYFYCRPESMVWRGLLKKSMCYSLGLEPVMPWKVVTSLGERPTGKNDVSQDVLWKGPWDSCPFSLSICCLTVLRQIAFSAECSHQDVLPCFRNEGSWKSQHG